MRSRFCVCLFLTWSVSLLPAATIPTVRAVEPAYLDRSAAPCTDFYHFANGAFAKVEIPADQSAWGVNEEIDQRNDALLREILEKAAREGGPAGSIGQRLGDFYASGMDEKAIAAAGLTPVTPILADIAGIKAAGELPAAFGRLHRQGIAAGFAFDVAIDDKDSSSMIVRLGQGGWNLPERNYYFDDSPEAQRIRGAYVTYIARLLTLADEPVTTAPATAAAIMALETKLAEASRTLEALQDPEANYHKFTRAELGTGVAALDWAGYFAAIELPPAQRDFIVGQPEFFPRLAELLFDTPLATWRSYLRFQVLDAVASSLAPEFEQARFDFHGVTLRGATEMRPRWKRVLGAIDAGVGEDLAQRYVQRAFSPEAKARALELIRFTLAAMRVRVARATWMSDATKDAAIHKLDTIRLKIGYPDVWRDYRALTISRQPYVLNVLAGRAFEFRRHRNQLGQPVDHNEWWLTPQTNNAWYDTSQNEMVFPAGILQPPFFDVNADDASNFGGIGCTIGHELTHGFDDSGRQYDAEGNLRDWWTAADAAAFQERAGFIAKQYDAFEVVPGVHLNGRQTLDENIADIGGALIAYDAFHLATAGVPAVDLDGFSPDQRFFIAFAQSWRTNNRPEWLRFLATADTHSPPRERVNGVLANMAAFFRAFGCPVPENLPPSIW